MSDPLDAAAIAEALQEFAAAERKRMKCRETYESGLADRAARALLAERQARLEAERRVAELELLVHPTLAISGTGTTPSAPMPSRVTLWRHDDTTIESAAYDIDARHASRPSDDRRETP